MSAEQMILTVLATNLAQAVAKDNDNPDGHDIASGLYGPAVSEWLREVAKELAPAEPVVLECKAGDLKALMRSHYERRPRAIAEQAEPHVWTRVVDEALTSYNLDVANESDDYATARGKMENLLAHAGNVGAYHAAEQAEPAGYALVPVDRLKSAAAQARVAADCIVGFAKDKPGKMCGWLDDACTAADTAAEMFSSILAAPPAPAAAEQAEPVVWECKAGGLKPLTQSQYDRQSDAIKRHYSRIETPAPAATGTAWALLKEAYDYGQFGDDFDRPLAKPVRAAIREVIRATSAEWERRFLAYDPSSDPAEAECDIPPHGWRCTRTKGHDGPCAAVAAPDDVALVRRSMARLAAAEQAEPPQPTNNEERHRG